MSDFTWEELESERAQSSRYPADRMPFSRTFRKRNRNAKASAASKKAKLGHREALDDNYFNNLLSS